MKPTAEALVLSKEVKKLKKKYYKIEKEWNDKTMALRKICTHDKLREEKNYIEGGYLNREEFITYYYCKICGEQVDKKVQYGSFG